MSKHTGQLGIPDGIDVDSIIQSATVVTDLAPYCSVINIDVDHNKVIDSVNELFKNLGIDDYDAFLKSQIIEFARRQSESGHHVDVPWAFDVNLNHLPGLAGKARWLDNRGTFEYIRKNGVDPADFTELLSDLDGLYVGDLIKNVLAYHKENYKNEYRYVRVTFMWLCAGQRYNFHVDPEDVMSIRYHIPVFTNEDCFWLFDDNDTHEYYKLHMAPGNVWEVDVSSIRHTVVNKSSIHRLHILLTVCV